MTKEHDLNNDFIKLNDMLNGYQTGLDKIGQLNEAISLEDFSSPSAKLLYTTIASDLCYTKSNISMEDDSVVSLESFSELLDNVKKQAKKVFKTILDFIKNILKKIRAMFKGKDIKVNEKDADKNKATIDVDYLATKRLLSSINDIYFKYGANHNDFNMSGDSPVIPSDMDSDFKVIISSGDIEMLNSSDVYNNVIQLLKRVNNIDTKLVMSVDPITKIARVLHHEPVTYDAKFKSNPLTNEFVDDASKLIVKDVEIHYSVLSDDNLSTYDYNYYKNIGNTSKAISENTSDLISSIDAAVKSVEDGILDLEDTVDKTREKALNSKGDWKTYDEFMIIYTRDKINDFFTVARSLAKYSQSIYEFQKDVNYFHETIINYYENK